MTNFNASKRNINALLIDDLDYVLQRTFNAIVVTGTITSNKVSNAYDKHAITILKNQLSATEREINSVSKIFIHEKNLYTRLFDIQESIRIILGEMTTLEDNTEVQEDYAKYKIILTTNDDHLKYYFSTVFYLSA